MLFAVSFVEAVISAGFTPDGITIELLPMGRSPPKPISVGLAPMGSQLYGYGADQPLFAASPVTSPAESGRFLSEGVACQLGAPIGASPMDAG